MKNLYKLMTGVFALLLFTTACDDDRDIVTISDGATTTLEVTQNNIVLQKDYADYDALTMTWTEPYFGYESAINYTIYIDVTGNDFANAVTLSGSISRSYTLTTARLNSMLINTFDATAGEATSVDIKVEASVSDYYEALDSNIQTITVTPYTTLIEPTSWGVVGSAAPNGWDGPDVSFWPTDTDLVYAAYVTLTDGEIKFRENNSWDNNYGDTGVDGILNAGGDNIAVTAGTYKITLDFRETDDDNDGEIEYNYTIEEYSWGLVGDATTNAWDGPDMVMSYDGTIDSWTITATLTDGEMKFRLNNDWGLNYGDDGANGTLDNGGANIVVSQGTYLITMSLTDLTYNITTP